MRERLNEWISPVGWVAIGGVAVAVVLGWPRGWTELRVIGVACGVLLVFSALWLLGRTAYDVRFDLHRQRVVAGESASGRVVIANRGRRALFGTRIELNVGRGRAHFMLPALAADEVHEQLFDIPTRRRGVITIGPVASVRTDPVGLLRRTRRWTGSIDLHVHPRTVGLSHDSTGFIRDVEGVTTQELSSSDVSFHALREYQPGDDRRAIHWRTTARVGRLMVRQFEETRRAHLLVIVPTHLDDHASADELELVISVAGSLARHAFSLERQVTLVTSGGMLEARTAPMMLDRLAELEPAAVRVPLPELAARAASVVPQASVAAILAGAGAQAVDLRRAHRALPVSISTFAVRCAAGHELAHRRIGDLTALDVPDLASLPKALRGLR
ncbi:DUF58 domain-containing protein [Nocardioides sp. AE5]|uniref:DUF58 domain-containing protein n=1 Tax=Nocardioides sp. AE5 TaxID=2962573 RepID=UPI002882B2C2|nr:DUF58 domain-containing protein [Nocardioides sp. AE5]MDT0200342.1 DUF58 domain-containing protein [Nocardioides sp. AE5]